MIAILSPAKSMKSDYTQQLPESIPIFLNRTDTLLAHMKQLSKQELIKLQSVSASIAELNHLRYQDFVSNASGQAERAIHDRKIFKQAGLVFDGPAYRGLDLASLSHPQALHAQKHVRLLSGLYGYLRPGDLIQEYRLEMGTRFNSGPTKSLYDYWGQVISTAINDELNDQTKDTSIKQPKVVINIASAEYFKVVRLNILDPDVKIVECVFKDKGKVVSVHAKRARGLMARFIAVNAISSGSAADIKLLTKFDYEGYAFVPSQSSETCLVFDRKSAPTAASQGKASKVGPVVSVLAVQHESPETATARRRATTNTVISETAVPTSNAKSKRKAKGGPSDTPKAQEEGVHDGEEPCEETDGCHRIASVQSIKKSKRAAR